MKFFITLDGLGIHHHQGKSFLHLLFHLKKIVGTDFFLKVLRIPLLKHILLKCNSHIAVLGLISEGLKFEKSSNVLKQFGLLCLSGNEKVEYLPDEK